MSTVRPIYPETGKLGMCVQQGSARGNQSGQWHDPIEILRCSRANPKVETKQSILPSSPHVRTLVTRRCQSGILTYPDWGLWVTLRCRFALVIPDIKVGFAPDTSRLAVYSQFSLIGNGLITRSDGNFLFKGNYFLSYGFSKFMCGLTCGLLV